MNSAPSTHHRHISFSVDKSASLDALEAVLAIARRGGLDLGTLQLRSEALVNAVFLDLLAPDPDLLELFVARLRNVIGLADIDSVAPPCTPIHASST